MDVVSFYCWSLMIVAGWPTALLSEDSHILLCAVTVINLWKQSTIFRYPVFLHVSFGFSCCRRLVSSPFLCHSRMIALLEEWWNNFFSGVNNQFQKGVNSLIILGQGRIHIDPCGCSRTQTKMRNTF